MGLIDRYYSWRGSSLLEEEGTGPPASEASPLNANGGVEFAKKEAAKLVEMTKEGPLSFRILAFLGGLGMIAAGILDLVLDSITFHPAGLLVAAYALVFGVIIVAIEGKRFDIPDDIERKAKFYFRILDYTWGRGGLYAFAGSLLLTQPSKVNFGVGAYMIFVGAVALISSMAAGKKLAEMRVALDSKREMRNLFDMHDTSGKGRLSTAEFAGLMGDCGVDVTYQELVACFNAIDKDDDNGVTFQEMEFWWNNFGSKKLPRNLGDLMV